MSSVLLFFLVVKKIYHFSIRGMRLSAGLKTDDHSIDDFYVRLNGKF